MGAAQAHRTSLLKHVLMSVPCANLQSRSHVALLDSTLQIYASCVL
jgi:hypothetical protein